MMYSLSGSINQKSRESFTHNIEYKYVKTALT